MQAGSRYQKALPERDELVTALEDGWKHCNAGDPQSTMEDCIMEG